jgi:hypothetical protein
LDALWIVIFIGYVLFKFIGKRLPDMREKIPREWEDKMPRDWDGLPPVLKELFPWEEEGETGKKVSPKRSVRPGRPARTGQAANTRQEGPPMRREGPPPRREGPPPRREGPPLRQEGPPPREARGHNTTIPAPGIEHGGAECGYSSEGIMPLFDRGAIINGVIFSELLQPPKCRRRNRRIS